MRTLVFIIGMAFTTLLHAFCASARYLPEKCDADPVVTWEDFVIPACYSYSCSPEDHATISGVVEADGYLFGEARGYTLAPGTHFESGSKVVLRAVE